MNKKYDYYIKRCIYDKVSLAIDNKKLTVALDIFINLSSAFDTSSHNSAT
mgnify:CR=1 FL=1